MPRVSPRMFWTGLAGLNSAFLFAGLMLWAASEWDARDRSVAPIHISKGPIRGDGPLLETPEGVRRVPTPLGSRSPQPRRPVPRSPTTSSSWASS